MQVSDLRKNMYFAFSFKVLCTQSMAEEWMNMASLTRRYISAGLTEHVSLPLKKESLTELR